MAFLYLMEQGSKAVKASGRIRVEKDDAVIAEIPILKLEGVVVYGNIGMTTPLLGHLLKEAIPVHFLDFRGKPRGQLRPIFSPHGEMRKAQSLLRLDEKKLSSLCAALVRGKINNQKVLLQRHNRRKRIKRVETVINFLNECLEKLRKESGVDEIRGMEGYSSSVYFSALRELLPKEIGFLHRTRKPPKDAVNAMLSFGYALLLSNIIGAVEAVGLDPYQGFLHSYKYGKPSLALDLIEEWRPALVDSLVITLINRGAFQVSDFCTEEDMVRFKDDALRRFITHYNEAIYRRFLHPARKNPVTYLEAFHIQARRFARAITQNLPYEPMLIR